jgi:hypothetical protein
MSTEMERPAATIGAEVTLCEEVPMVRRERWEEIRRLWVAGRVPLAEIARHLDLDRKTVRRCLRDTAWRLYHRPTRPETLLTAHAEYLRERAGSCYSAKTILTGENVSQPGVPEAGVVTHSAQSPLAPFRV